MSGTISFSPAGRWSAASWLFDWVLSAIAATVEDAGLAAELTEIVGENIVWLSLEDLTDEQNADMRRAIRESIGIAAERGLPVGISGREDVLRHLNDLILLASDTAPG